MKSLRAAWRLAHALGHAVVGWLTIVLLFPRLDAHQRADRVQAWAARLLRILGIALEVRGTPAGQGPMLLVANHISWLDIPVLHASRYCRFVAKSEVHRWPLVGSLATGAGTLYVERASRRDAMRVVHRMAESLQAGDILAIFPEGTTSDGSTLLPFHANLVQAAVSAQAPVQPVSLQFIERRTGRRSRAAAYIGDDSLVGSIWATLAGEPVTATVNYGRPQDAQGRDRRAWAADLQAEVDRLRQG
ncbi:MAG TPA: lysophospholipid acyltransferase family protein [Ramlibacter sp.]|nr:lysophospholipid acyltransferase family protein [Ramlibacter sp.]